MSAAGGPGTNMVKSLMNACVFVTHEWTRESTGARRRNGEKGTNKVKGRAGTGPQAGRRGRFPRAGPDTEQAAGRKKQNELDDAGPKRCKDDAGRRPGDSLQAAFLESAAARRKTGMTIQAKYKPTRQP